MDKNFKHAYIYLFFDIKFTSFINKACPKKLALLSINNSPKQNKRTKGLTSVVPQKTLQMINGS